MIVLNRMHRFRQPRTAQPIKTVRFFGREQLMQDGPRASSVNRDVTTPRSVNNAPRIAGGMAQRNIASNGRDVQSVGNRQGEQKGKGIVLARITVEDDRQLCHGAFTRVAGRSGHLASGRGAGQTVFRRQQQEASP